MSDQISDKLSSKLFLLGTMASVPGKDTLRTDDKFLTEKTNRTVRSSNKPLTQMNKRTNEAMSDININLKS